ITIDGPTELALGDDTAARFAAYGWRVVRLGEIANDVDALADALRGAKEPAGGPTLLILRSHIGYPSAQMMDRREAHGSPFSAAAITEAKAVLGIADEPFALDPALPDELRASLVGQRDDHAAWESRNRAAGPRGLDLAQRLATHGAVTAPVAVEPFAPLTMVATRKALQRTLDALAPDSPGLTAGSADLTDNTGVVLAGAGAQGSRTPGGRQIYYGVREFAMGAVVNGQALHGGVRPIGATFFVFSDYMRPAIRLAALSDAPALFAFTHDSIGVGEDGPTHQPVEHLMALRAMPVLHVVRPSDANETIDLAERFLRDPRPAPTALVLTRQDVPVLGGDDAAASRADAWRGGYVVRERDDALYTLVATGSEVAHCLSAADELAGLGVATRVVALPCWRCFDAQDAAYQARVLRRSTPSVSLEAGATLGWHRYVDHAIGIDRFGMSAPGPVTFDELGINPAALVSHVVSALEVAR
ncbi:MAG: transketolase-like TK C-terminal-containing protein, partial [Acidimicrobiales bacterium]